MSLTDMVIMPGADYQAACDAVREKTGGMELIKSGELGGLIRGISGDSGEMLDGLIARSATHIKSETVTEIGGYAFEYYTKLVSVDFASVTDIGDSAFLCCDSLAEVSLPSARVVGGGAFYECTALAVVDLPSAVGLSGEAFRGCEALKVLCLRNATSVVRNYGWSNLLSYTPIESGEGHIYVPSALVDSYKAHEQWSYFAAQFRALEDYTVDGTITGALDETKINATT